MPTYYSSNADGDLDTVYLHNYEEYLITDTFVTSGRLWGWGVNTLGALGDNSITSRSSPVQTVSGGTDWKIASAGAQYAAGIKSDNTLWLWGIGTSGQLGNNAQTSRSSPVQTVSGGTNWKSVSCGATHTASIKTDGSLWVWGAGTSGRLGTNDTTNRSSPVQTVSGGTNWRSVFCGQAHTAAIKTDGTLWLWGSNTYGELGDNTTAQKSSPVQTVAGGNNWRQVSCSNQISAAVKNDGTLWLWGDNAFGQLGDNTNGNGVVGANAESSPVQIFGGGTNWKFISAGYYMCAAIKTDGTLWLWGYNAFGGLGTNENTSRSSPVQTVSGGTDWVKIGVTSRGTASPSCAAIKTNGTLWTWGLGGSGQLGDNTSTGKSSPVQTVAGGNNWRDISNGNQYVLATTY